MFYIWIRYVIIFSQKLFFFQKYLLKPGVEISMYRFYISKDNINNKNIYITGQDVNHIKNVLRLEKGSWIIACDGEGMEYISRITDMDSKCVKLEVEKIQESDTEPGTKLVLFQGLPKKDKMEFIIQKSVELGVSEIIPVITKRCVVKLDENKAHKKQERWQAIAEAAAKQSGRGIVPEVHVPVILKDAFDIAAGLEYNIIPYELQDGMEQSRKIINEACSRKSAGIFIGPEGGFEKEEVKEAVDRGIWPVSLGKRILRTETAGMAVLSIMMFQMQE